jgi:large subunit ribosomal protein L2
MPVRVYKKNTAARRRSSVQDFSDITRKNPKKSLVKIKKRSGGRDQLGHISVRHRGGGAKRYIRMIDWRQNRYDEPAKVQSIEYDPNRGARIALVQYPDGEERYILAPADIGVGHTIMSSQVRIDVQVGNRFPLAFIPIGQQVHNIEVSPGRGGAMVRGAGTSAQLMAVEGEYAQLKLPSGEVRLVRKMCSATLGSVSNPDWRHIKWGSAGRSRHRGIRPTVRGKVMNPVDHPHGGGEGKNPIGLKKGPKTPWGKPALGVKTRKKKKYSDKLIVRRRKKKRR